MSGCPHPQMPSPPARPLPRRLLSHLLALGCSGSIPPCKGGEVGDWHGRGGGHPGLALLHCSITHPSCVCHANGAHLSLSLSLQCISRSSLAWGWPCSASASSWAAPCAGGIAGARALASAGSGQRWGWDPLCPPGRCQRPSSSTMRRWQERCWVLGPRKVPWCHQHLTGVCSMAEPPCPASPSPQSRREHGSAAALSPVPTSSAMRKTCWTTLSWDPPPHCPPALALSSVPSSTATCSTHQPRPRSP